MWMRKREAQYLKGLAQALPDFKVRNKKALQFVPPFLSVDMCPGTDAG
jgi:hypothetical protein